MEMGKSMEARLYRAALWAAVLLVSMGARVRTPNFMVETPDPRLARKIAQAAEKHRRELAVAWLGKAMPNWSQPCVMTVHVGPRLGAGGATSFVFDRGEVFGWRMTIQGPAQRILDSVLPHEITHMIFASHFRRPLPRWADEGGATSVEHVSEKAKHRKMLVRFLRTGRGIAFSRMFAMKQYPRDVMPLYAQGYSLAEFLIQRGGRRKYVAFVEDGLKTDDWSGAIRRHYGVTGLGALQNTWLAWVRQGSPLKKRPADHPAAAPEKEEMLAATGRRPRPEPNLIYWVPKNKGPAHAPGSVVRAQGSDRTPTEQLAAADPPREPNTVRLPSSGWRAAGAGPSGHPARSATRPSSPGPIRSQLTRPQPFQGPQPIYPQRRPPTDRK